LIFLGVVVIGVIGYAANLLMGWIEHNIAPWAEEDR